MKIIKLDASGWKTILEYWNDLRASLGAPDGYAGSIDGMLELMVWDYAHPQMVEWHAIHDKPNAPKPPYTIRILNAEMLPQNIRDEIELLIRLLSDSRKKLVARDGRDVDVNLEIVSYH